MTRAPKPVRATLKALWREFQRCSNLYLPLYHELFRPWPDLSGYDAVDVGESFAKAFADHFQDDWEEWHGPDDVSFFGRFFGSDDGLEDFEKLAESAYLTVCEVGPTDPEYKHALPPEHGHHGWLKLLSDMAFGYPTPLLRCEFTVWDENERTGLEEELARLGTPEGGGTPYPLHPFHMRLVHSVFTSSMAAIELILDDDRGLLIDNNVWGLPISFSSGTDQAEVKRGEEHAVDQGEIAVEQKQEFLWPVLEFWYDGMWHLRFNTGDDIESGTFPQKQGFDAYQMLLSRPNVNISPETLLKLEGAVVQQAERSLPRKGLRRQLAHINKEIDDTINEERKQELRQQHAHLLERIEKAGGSVPSIPRLLTKRVDERFRRIRAEIKEQMPRFAEYLEGTITSEDCEFMYRPGPTRRTNS